MNEPREIVGICGIGQMGSSAAVLFQRAGYCVLLWARNAEKLKAVRRQLDQLAAWSEKHLGPPSQAGGEIVLEPGLERLDARADVVLDCILEVLDQKVDLFRRLPQAKARGALFLSATSGLSITEMGRRGECESLLVGAHFWNPPHLIPVVEVIAGDTTPAPTVDRACELLQSIGSVPVRCRDVPGFIGNRLLHAMWREALALVDAGVCSAEDIDIVTKLTFALRLPALGPMENMDVIGLDAVERIQKYLLPDLAANKTPSITLSSHVAAGRLGTKAGTGFYDWSTRDAGALLRARDLQIVRQLQFLREIGHLK